MQTRDDQMIFEKYQQIDEITIPFSGGKKFGVMNRFKKMLPGQWGKKAKAGINIESDVNHFIELLNNLSHTTGESPAAIIKSPKFGNWIKNTIKVDPTHIPNWAKLIKSGDVNNLINAAVVQRNKDYAYGVGHGATDTPTAAASAPETTGDTSLPATQAAATQAATTPQATASSATTPAAAQSPVQPAAAAPKSVTVAQSKKAIDDAAATVGSVRTRDRARLIDYALDKFAAVEGSKQPAAAPKTKASPASSIRTAGNVKPSAPRKSKVTAKESVYINSNVVTKTSSSLIVPGSNLHNL